MDNEKSLLLRLEDLIRAHWDELVIEDKHHLQLIQGSVARDEIHSLLVQLDLIRG